MLEIKNLSYKTDEKIILNNLNYKFEENKIYAITGPNGSGKSTLCKIIMGLINPTSGEILLNGKKITKLDATTRANLGISYAFQTPVIFKNFQIYDLFKVINDECSLDDIKEYLKKVGLCPKEYINRAFDDTLSGGERKRIELALTLYKNGIVNLFDEPEAGIDLWSIHNLKDAFNNIKNEKINIIVTHQESIIDLADEVIVIDNGEITNDSFCNHDCESCRRHIS